MQAADWSRSTESSKHLSSCMMWRLLHQKGGPRTGVDDLAPTAPSEDENSYGGSDNSSPQALQAAPVRLSRPQRPSYDSLKGLPALPFEAIGESAPKQNKYRPASSVYSQPSPNLPSSRFPRTSLGLKELNYSEDVEISPPSSPDTARSTTNTAYSNVSPIEENPHTAYPNVSPIEESPPQSISHTTRPSSKGGGSSIPILRRERLSDQGAPTATDIHTGDGRDNGAKSRGVIPETRWDTLTGEPTTSEKGQPLLVKPGDFDPVAYENARGRKHSLAQISAPKAQSSFGARVRKLKESSIMTSSRPEWKGSSGRSKVIAPVTDQPNMPPLHIPRKSSKRATSPREDSEEKTFYTDSRSGTAPPRVSPMMHRGPNDMTTKLIIPPGARFQDTSSHIVASPESFNQKASPAIEPHKSPQDKDFQPPSQPRGISPSFQAQQQVQANTADCEESTSSIERKFREALKDVNLPSVFPDQPVSRFSVTTYATTTASSTPRGSTESLRQTPTPPVQLSPVLNRRRPKVGSSFDSAKATTRKAVGDPVFISMTGSIASRRNSKMLPKSPPEVESVDQISSLQAQLSNLAQRRVNIQRGIHQMTELMPQDTIGMGRGSEARRQAEEKKKVELLREDLADIQREEHDLGLKLHRAWKRKDSQAIYEPTGLWVRRVTG